MSSVPASQPPSGEEQDASFSHLNIHMRVLFFIFFFFHFSFLRYKSDQGEKNHKACCFVEVIMHYVRGLVISVGLEKEVPRYMYASDNHEEIAMKHDDKNENQSELWP